MKSSVASKYKPLFVPLAGIAVLVVLVLVLGNFFFENISNFRSEIRKIEASNLILDERLNTLQSVAEELSRSTEIVNFALPEDSPGVLVALQIRSLARDKEVLLEDFTIRKTSLTINETIETSDIEFEASGEFTAVTSLVEELSGLLPLVNLQSVNVEDDFTGGVTASVRLSTYSAPLPETLPSLTESINGLTAAEEETLEQLSFFNRPNVPSNIPASTGSGELILFSWRFS